MSIRERQLNSVSFASGQTVLIDLPRDAVFHWLTLSVYAGTFNTVQGVGGTGPTLVPGFPFSLMRSLRVLRNGSDVVFQGSGEQLALEAYYLNKQFPLARLYTTTGNVETLRTATVRGVTVPANSAGLGSFGGGYTEPSAPSSSGGNLQFDFQVDLYFQMGDLDSYYGSLVDARKLATFQLEIIWATEASQIAAAGVTNGASTAAFSMQILSVDQDNLDVANDFGTFKRSTMTLATLPYGSSNNQVLLPRGNFFQGIIITSKAFKTGSSVNPIFDNGIIGTIDNRINSNFSLRKNNFNQLQARNSADAGGRPQPWQTAQGSIQGAAYLSYTNAAQKASELVPTYVMDQFDLQMSINPAASAQNGATTGSTNPYIELLMEEVIPGVSIGSASPRGAQAGSISSTSAKPYVR